MRQRTLDITKIFNCDVGAKVENNATKFGACISDSVENFP